MNSIETEPIGQFPRFVAPGRLSLHSVRWGRGEAHVEGDVGGTAFTITVSTGDLLNRRRFGFNLWRFRHLLAIQPDLHDWKSMVAQAEGGGE